MAIVPFWIIALLMLGLLIIVHELGHYTLGRILGFDIEEFSVGMGPKILSKISKKTNIRYSLRGIPLGGFVAFSGEDEDNDKPGAMNNMPWYKRAIVFFAGAGFNIIFAFLIIAILISAIGYNSAKIESIDERSGLYSVAQQGDVIYAVNNKQVMSVNDFAQQVKDMDDKIVITALRNGTKVDYECSKVLIDNDYRVGITYSAAQIDQNIFQALSYSAKYNVYMAKTMYSTLWQLLTGKIGTEALSGPISTIGAIGDVVQQNSTYAQTTGERIRDASITIGELLSIISLNLAIMNLLPLPALDGFRFFGAIIEGITKKHIPRKVEGIVNGIGLAVLCGLMLVLELSKLF